MFLKDCVCHAEVNQCFCNLCVCVGGRQVHVVVTMDLDSRTQQDVSTRINILRKLQVTSQK